MLDTVAASKDVVNNANGGSDERRHWLSGRDLQIQLQIANVDEDAFEGHEV